MICTAKSMKPETNKLLTLAMFIAVLATVFLVFASPAVAKTSAEKPWSDWPDEAIVEAQYMNNLGVFLGKSDGTFDPKGVVSERTVALIAQRIGADTPDLNDYSGIPAQKDWVLKHFLPRTGQSNPGGKITRFQFLLMSYRWLQNPDRPMGIRPIPKHKPASMLGAKVDSLMSRYPDSKLRGKGTFIVNLSEKYKIPLDLALAMFAKESTFCSNGRNVPYNNPGSLKPGGRLAKYPTIEAGIEAYFKLLATGPSGSGYYLRSIKAGDYRALYNKYAPPSSNPGYIGQVEYFRLKLIRPALGM